MSRRIEAVGLMADYIQEGDYVSNPPVGQVLMSDPRSPYYERPMGFYSEALRQSFIDSSARMGGVGGGGATLAVMLAKEGVGDFSIADIDRVEESNVGRIPIFEPAHVGKFKVDVVADLITRMNPTATVRVYGEGVQKNNADEFMGYDAKNKGLTVFFDGIDVTCPGIALLTHRAARRAGIYAVSATDVERGGFVTTFDPNDIDHTFEHYMGCKPTDNEETYLRKVRGFQLPTIPNLPKNGSLSTLIATQFDNPKPGLPTTLRSVLNATDLAMDEFEKLLTLGDPRYGDLHFFPRMHAVNPSQGEDFVTRHPRLQSTARVLVAAVRSALGQNPLASYNKADRDARQAYRDSVAAGEVK